MAIFGLIRPSSILSYLHLSRHSLSGEYYEMGRRDSTAIAPVPARRRFYHGYSRRFRTLLVAGVLFSIFAISAYTMREYLLLSLLTGAWATPLSLVTGSSAGYSGNHQRLRFTEQGTFQLCVFNDLHYGESKSSLFHACCVHFLDLLYL